MFDMISSRSLRAACVALCVAALPLSGCPEEEENNKTTADMATVAQDMGTADTGSGTPDGGTVTPDAKADTDAGSVDAGADVDAGSVDAGNDVDAGASMCEAGVTECSTNDQCADTERCESMEGSLVGCCIEGVRGTKAAGEECTSGDECISSICIDSTQDGTDDDVAPDYCSKVCLNDDNMPDDSLCPTQLPKCNLATALCIPPSPE